MRHEFETGASDPRPGPPADKSPILQRAPRTEPAFARWLLGIGLVVTLSAGGEARMKAQAPSSGREETQSVIIGRLVFGQSCIQCHSMNEVLIQRKPASQWRDVVFSMISRGALLTPDEIDPLVAYLAATYGPNAPLLRAASNSKSTGAEIGPPAENLPEGEGKRILSRACVKCHNLSLVAAARKSEDEWVITVARMVIYGARLESTEQQALVRYLAANRGAKQ